MAISGEAATAEIIARSKGQDQIRKEAALCGHASR
jgi:hypothetical protein